MNWKVKPRHVGAWGNCQHALYSEHPKARELWRAVAGFERKTVSIHVREDSLSGEENFATRDLAMEDFLSKIRAKFQDQEELGSQASSENDNTPSR